MSMVLSFSFSILITKGLDVAAYGSFRYTTTFLTLAMTLLQFGLPYSAARVLALENDRIVQKEIVGACVVIVLLSTFIGASITLITYFASKMLGHPLPNILIYVAPFLYVTLGQGMITSVCQGLNRISVLSFQQVLPYLLLLPITAVQIYIFHNYSLQSAIVGYLATFTIVIAFGFARIGTIFSRWRFWSRAIVGENRRTGFPIYVGGIFGVASAQVTALWVANFTDAARYGQYALALAVASPLSVSVSSIGTVIFRSSSGRKSLSSKILLYSFGLGIVLAVAYYIATETLLIRAFGEKYAPSVRMAQALGAASLLVGWGDIFQRHLGAQARGRALCVVAISTGMVGMISAFFLLPRWNAYGAIASSSFAAATYFIFTFRLYLRHTKARTEVPHSANRADPDLSIAC